MESHCGPLLLNWLLSLPYHRFTLVREDLKRSGTGRCVNKKAEEAVDRSDFKKPTSVFLTIPCNIINYHKVADEWIALETHAPEQ